MSLAARLCSPYSFTLAAFITDDAVFQNEREPERMSSRVDKLRTNICVRRDQSGTGLAVMSVTVCERPAALGNETDKRDTDRAIVVLAEKVSQPAHERCNCVPLVTIVVDRL